jgi:phosphonate transport system substrate-binding protein
MTRLSKALVRWLLIAAALLAAGLPAVATAAPATEPQRPLVMGILPFMSPIALIKRFAPLRDYLSQQIGRPVILQTARDFPEFVRRTQRRHYDIVLTAPHMVLLALDSGHYRLQAAYADPLAAVILVPKGSSIRSMTQLNGKVVATPPPEAIITVIGRRMLADAGLTGERAPLYRNYLSHNAAYQAVVGGEASAAVVTVNVVHNVVGPGKPLRVLARSGDYPGLGILTGIDLPANLQRRIGDALVDMRNTQAGRDTLKRIRYSGYRRAKPSEFEPLRTYLGTCGLPSGDGEAPDCGS